MAVTRIKNNQITDSTIQANAKVVDYSITSSKLANNLTYNSDLTITGNLTVNGNTTTIDTTIVTVEDPMISLAYNQTGSPTLDIGWIGVRGTSNNVAFIWQESSEQFIAAYTNDDIGNTTISILGYANLAVLNANITGTLTAANVSLTGNIDGNLNVTGNISGGNIATSGIISATGTGTFGNVATGGTVSATGDITGGNVTTAGQLGGGTASVTGNVAGGNFTTGGIVSATGTITGGNVETGGTISATGNITGGNVTTAGQLGGGTASVTGTITGGNVETGGTVSATGTITGGNVNTAGAISATGNITGGNILFGSGIVSGTGNVYATNFIGNISGNIDAAGSNTQVQFNDNDLLAASANFTFDQSTNTLTVSNGNIVGGNLETGGTVSATGTITGGNVTTGGTVSATGTVTGGNVATGGTVSATGDITGGNVTTAGQLGGGTASVTGTITGGNLATGGTVSATGDITGANVLTGGIVSATGNITGNYFIGNGALLTGIDAAGIQNGNSNVRVTANGNITMGVTGVANVVVVTPTGIETNTITATGTVTGGNLSTGGTVSATGTITGGNLATGGTVSATGNVTGGNILTGGLISATGTIDSAANITGANILTAGDVSATGNLIGNNVNTDTVYSSGGLNLIAASGDITLDTSGNVNASNNYINNVSNPVQAQDAATKQYVDDAVSTGITIHPPVYLESPTALNGTYAQGGNTFTVNQTIAGNTVVFTTAANLQPNDQLWFSNSFEGIVANTAYFVVSTPNTSAAVLSTTYNGVPVSNITSNTGLTQSVRVNSGQGATLTNAGANATLVIDGVSTTNGIRVLIYNQANAAHNGVYNVTEAGNATTAWQLTRSSDMNTYIPNDINGLDAGDYFYVQAGDTGAGESYVMTAPVGPTIIGYDNLTFTQFSASQVYTANTAAGLSLTGTVFSAKVDNDTTAFDGGGNIIVKAGANLTTPNIGVATGTSLSLTGTATAGNLATGGTVSATGDITGGNVLTTGIVSATGNITGNYFIGNGSQLTGVTAASVDANALTGNTLSSNVTFSSLTSVGTLSSLSVAGNTTSGNLITGGIVSATGEISSAANITGANILTGGTVSATGNITGGNIDTAGTVLATGNIQGGNINTSGNVSATGAIIADDGFFGNIDITGDITVNSLSSNTFVSASGTITGGNLATGGTVSATGTITGGNVDTGGTISATGTITGGNVDTGGTVSATGDITGGAFSTTGNVTGGNILFGSGIVSGTGNIYADNIFANISGNIDAAGNINEVQFNGTGDILAASAGFTFDPSGNILTANGNINGANFLTTGIVSATGNISGNYFIGNGALLTGIDTTLISNGNSNVQVYANGNVAVSITGTSNTAVFTAGGISLVGNVDANNVSATGTLTGGNIVISGDNITGNNGTVNINSGLSDVDFVVNGNSLANIFYVDAGTGTASFGTSTQTTNALVAFNSTNSILVPVGNTQQRPGTGVTGMIRFNTTLDKMEVYDSNSWAPVGDTTFTVIDDQQFSGDGSTLAFTLNSNQTTNSCIVSINGVVQIPTSAYSVSGTTLTFTEAPLSGDLIDVRQITTTTTVVAIQNTNGNAAISVNDTSNIISVTGQLQGSGNSLTIAGDLSVTGNVNITGNIATNQINNGTSAVQIPTSSGNVNIDVGAVDNMTVFASTGMFVTGNVSVTGNVTAQDVNSLSDVTLKTNIQPISGIESVLFGLKGYEYDWKNGSGHSYGFLAQEVEKVLPNAVKTGADGLKAINYMMIIPFLVETIKQMGTEINDLKKTVNKSRGKKK